MSVNRHYRINRLMIRFSRNIRHHCQVSIHFAICVIRSRRYLAAEVFLHGSLAHCFLQRHRYFND